MNWVLTLFPIALLFLGFPIFIILLATVSVAGLLFMNVPMTLVPQIMFGSLDKFTLLAVPLFIFAGEIMSAGGISKRIIACIQSIFGHLRGGVALSTVVTCEFFGAVSGSSPATVAAVGRLMYPALLKAGHSEKFSLGLITSSGAIASVMPPSITMIVYGASAEQSIAALFAGGVVPALLIGLIVAVYILWVARKGNIRSQKRASLATIGRATLDATWALGTPLVILGGIYLGIFSPTEASGVAGVYGIFVALVIYREIGVTEMFRITTNAVYLSSQILIIVAASGSFAWLLTVSGVPQYLVQVVGDIATHQWAVLLIINVFLLIVGCFIDPISAVIVLTPLLLPLLKATGVDLIHFGILMTVNLSIGMFTPPFGLNIFVSQSLFGAKVSTLYRGLVPFIILQIIALLIITYVPSLTLIPASTVSP